MYALPLKQEHKLLIKAKILEILPEMDEFAINTLVAELYERLHTVEEKHTPVVQDKLDAEGNKIPIMTVEKVAVMEAVPVMVDKEVPVLDEAGEPVLDEDGNPVVEVVKEQAVDGQGLPVFDEQPKLDENGEQVFEDHEVPTGEFEQETVDHVEYVKVPPAFKFNGVQVELILEEMVEAGQLMEI